MKNTILFFILILTSGFLFGQQSNILLKTDFKGKVTQRSIENLINNIQQGQAIRVGWQLDFNNDTIPDIEHWIDANFISILNGHVFNQIEPIYRQVPKMKSPQIEIIQSSMMWTAIIGTNGKLISRFTFPELHQIDDENIRKRIEETLKIEETIVTTIWAIKKSIKQSEN